ncbi:MAG: cation:proton antiporter, partial [Thermaerobacterales bacterium]
MTSEWRRVMESVFTMSAGGPGGGQDPFFVLAVILIGAELARYGARRLGQPGIVGYLLLGIILGPAGLRVVGPAPWLEPLAAIGMLMLLFIAGLSLGDRTADLARPAVLITSLAGVLVTVLAALFLASAWGWSVSEGVVLGALLAATSISVPSAVLREFGMGSTRPAATVVGAAILDDFLVLMLLGLVAASSFADQTYQASLFLLRDTFLSIAAVVVLTRVALRLDALQRLLGKTSTALGYCFALAYAAQAGFGLAAAMGSLVAGLALAGHPRRKRLEDHLELSGYAIFIPVFFVDMGLTVESVSVLLTPFILILVAAATVPKLAACYAGA